MNLPISIVSPRAHLESLLANKLHALPLAWSKDKHHLAQIQFMLAFNVERLFFLAQVDQSPIANLGSLGDFVEGLWNEDVLELFIANSVGRYFELNLSPIGAWWAQEFNSYRQRAHSFDTVRAGTLCFAKVGSDSWQAGLSIKLESLKLDFNSFQQAKFNVSAIINQKFYSWAKIKTPSPDFHRCDYFVSAEIVDKDC